MNRWKGRCSGRSFRAAAALCLLALSLYAVLRPHMLWMVVHDGCGVDMALRRQPFPCLVYDRTKGYAVLSVLGSQTHLLVVPTVPIRGIESPALIGRADPYWTYAWNARRIIDKRLGHAAPRDDIGLAINSRRGRTQDQLHIHVDCIDPTVIQQLREIEPQVGSSWQRLPFHIHHHTYSMMKLYGADLSGQNPIDALRNGDPSTIDDMQNETLAVLGATFADGTPGFLLLHSHAQRWNSYRGFSEELLDHSCRVLRRDP